MRVGVDQKRVAYPMKADEEETEAVSPANSEGHAPAPRACRGPVQQQHHCGVGKKQQGK